MGTRKDSTNSDQSAYYMQRVVAQLPAIMWIYWIGLLGVLATNPCEIDCEQKYSKPMMMIWMAAKRAEKKSYHPIMLCGHKVILSQQATTLWHTVAGGYTMIEDWAATTIQIGCFTTGTISQLLPHLSSRYTNKTKPHHASKKLFIWSLPPSPNTHTHTHTHTHTRTHTPMQKR